MASPGRSLLANSKFVGGSTRGSPPVGPPSLGRLRKTRTRLESAGGSVDECMVAGEG